MVTEPLGNYPLDHYQVIQRSIQSPIDTDGDGINDLDEYQNIPLQSPMNAAARPWVSYTVGDSIPIALNHDLEVFPNPAHDYITVQCYDCNLTKIRITDITGKQVEERVFNKTGNSSTEISVNNLSSGVYVISGFVGDNVHYHTQKFIKNTE